MMRRALPVLALLACAAAQAPPAGARVAVVAAGTPEALLLDVTTNAIVGRTPLAGPTRVMRRDNVWSA